MPRDQIENVRTDTRITTRSDREARASSSRELADLRRRLFDLHTVFDITRRFHAVLDTDALLVGILLTATGQLDVGAAALAVGNPDEPQRLSRCKWIGWTDANARDWELRQDSPIACALQQRRGPVRLADLLHDLPPGTPAGDRLQLLGCHMLAPLVGRAGLRGVLYLAARQNGESFSSDDLEFLGLVLEHVSVTLDNALLYESERATAAQLLEARARLARSEKMAALGNLSATVAHEVNNPLGIIKNYLQLLRPALADDPESSEKLDLIRHEVERLAQFVRRLLGALHPEKGTVQPVDCLKLIRDAVHFAKPETDQHQVGIICNLPTGAPPVAADAGPLRQVFLNLILNAMDAMPEGGRLTITATVKSDNLEIRVADEGPGIDAEVADNLFQPFVTTKTAGAGTGLGLTVCQTIIEGFGGTITAVNRPGPASGAVFSVCLPLAVSDDTESTGRQKAVTAGE